MNAGLDTSVIVRYVVGVPEEQAAAARRLIDAAGEPLAISDLAVGESYHVLRHHYGVPPARAIGVLLAFLREPGVRPTGAALRVLEGLAGGAGGSGLMDRLLHADYADAGLAFVTFDRAAPRLPGARLLTA